MTTHVFIVDSNTFKIHLENMFAGTGAKDYVIDFNNNKESSLNPTAERLLVGMTADACRIRKDDKIIFYLQQTKTRHTNEPKEGKFFGIFKAKNDWAFLDNNDENQFLKTELNKSLTFRVEIEPDNVYPLGVTEWEALDEIKSILSPHQMLWSMIYRKLRGKRGNTMITLYEAERLHQLIRDKNERQMLSNLKQLSFDEDMQKIIELEKDLILYKGNRKEPLNILPRLLEKYKNNLAFEIHLQSYIINYIGKNYNKSLDDSLLPPNAKIQWIGNEFGCGMGMQSIDIMIDYIENNQKVVSPIELKCNEIPFYITNQIQRYIDWIAQYYKSNRQCDISPVLVYQKRKSNSKQEIEKFEKITQKITDFNKKNEGICSPIKLIEFEIQNNNLFFSKIDY